MVNLEFQFPPVSRRNAPSTSHKAEEAITKSGKRMSIAQKVALAVRQHPGHTAAELASLPDLRLCSMNPLNTVRSRLSELQDARYPVDMRVRTGDKRLCQIHKTEQVTWYPL